MFSAEIMLDPFSLFSSMRESQPVLHVEQLGAHLLFRYADVKRAYEDNAVFSSNNPLRQPSNSPIVETMIFRDPPEHSRLRALAQSAFTPKAIAAIEPRIEDIARAHLDALATPDADFVPLFSAPFPALVIAELLGVDASRRAQFVSFANDIVASVLVPDVLTAVLDEFQRFSRAIVEEKRSHPDDRLLSQWLANPDMTTDEVVGLAILLLVAGHETTTNLLNNTVRCLSDAPHVKQRLIDNPALAPRVIDEVLRFRGPVLAAFRRTRTEVVLSETTIPADSLVLPLIGSANRDPSAFANPDVFDPDRSTRGLLSFGSGIHRCLGEPLARLETQLALRLLFKRYPALRVDPSRPIAPVLSPVVHGARSLPVVV
jgi:cytochrome P450